MGPTGLQIAQVKHDQGSRKRHIAKDCLPGKAVLDSTVAVRPVPVGISEVLPGNGNLRPLYAKGKVGELLIAGVDVSSGPP